LTLGDLVQVVYIEVAEAERIRRQVARVGRGRWRDGGGGEGAEEDTGAEG
jgi:hypothetical protein